MSSTWAFFCSAKLSEKAVILGHLSYLSEVRGKVILQKLLHNYLCIMYPNYF